MFQFCVVMIDDKYSYSFLIFQHEPIEQSLESFFKLIEVTIHTSEWLSQGQKSKRYVDNERPLTYNELNFLNEMRHKEIVLMRGKSKFIFL
jgi:orotate phosphoribosyltransferase